MFILYCSRIVCLVFLVGDLLVSIQNLFRAVLFRFRLFLGNTLCDMILSSPPRMTFEFNLRYNLRSDR